MSTHQAKSRKSARTLLRSRSVGPLIFSAELPSDAAEIEPFVGRALAEIDRRGCLNGAAGAIEVALQEAVANAIVHGNRTRRRKRVSVQCFGRPGDDLLLVVRDQGRGFDPSRVADPTTPENLLRSTGRGIFLIRRFMDDVKFERGGREIRMRKRPPAE